MKENKIFFLTIVVLLALLLVTTYEFDERTVSTQGEASQEYSPDVFKATIGMQRETTDVTEAEREINNAINNMVTDLEELGVEIKKHDYSINPMFTTRDEREPEYRVRQTLQVETKDLDLVNEILEVSSNNGANIVQGLRFELSDEKKSEVEAELLERAMEQARNKAEATANAENDRVGKVLKVEIGSTGYMPYRMESMDSVAETASPDIQPGVVEHSMRVNVQFKLR